MCKETFNVVGLENERTAYEVEEFLTGVPEVQQASADFLNDEIVVQYDESQLTKDTVLDMIEHSGCKPEARIDGIIEQVQVKLSQL